jgi:predicted metal-dependent phosphotriesterase family hydrolase
LVSDEEETLTDGAKVNTVLGPIAAGDLGVVSVHERLLSVFPGAQYAYDLPMDRAEIFETLAGKLTVFQNAGGGTIVDCTGMFHGRDLTLLETLSRSTGVHIVASTGMGPEGMLGGYFLTPQSNPPTPWPAEKFADLFAREITEGMVVPRLERRGTAGIVATAATTAGMTAVDESLARGAARAALATGAPASIRFGADAVHDLEVVLDEGLAADRVVVGGLDRRDATTAHSALEVARRGAYAAIDHVGSRDEIHVGDEERAAVIAELVSAGHVDRILLSSAAIGYAVGEPANELPYDHVLAAFVPRLREQGVSENDVRRVLIDNPRDLLTVLTPSAIEAPSGVR